MIIIALWICLCMYVKRYSEQKQERERETDRQTEREPFDLSECICYNRTETVVVTVVGKRRKTLTAELADRKFPFFLFLIPLITAVWSLFSFGSAPIFISLWYVVHLLNIPVSRTIPSSFSLDNINFNRSIVY